MDRRMPVMDGIEATRRIKAMDGGASTPIIIVSASALEEDREEVLSAGADGFVRKPVLERDLFQTIARVTGLSVHVAHSIRAAETQHEELGGAGLQQLPAETRSEMLQSLETGDMAAVEDILTVLAPRHEAAVRLLRTLADRYDYEALLRLLSPGRRDLT